ncbi:MAG: hypothetical protein AAF847_07915 [Bacteroidota bacterium]
MNGNRSITDSYLHVIRDEKVHFYFDHFVELLNWKNVELIVLSLPLADSANGTERHYQFDN